MTATRAREIRSVMFLCAGGLAASFAPGCSRQADPGAASEIDAAIERDASTAPRDASMAAHDAGRPPGPLQAVVAEPEDEAAYIYDPGELRTYELRIAQADFDALNADPAAEEYVPGTLIFEGAEYGPVGVRYKGSAGAFIGCVSGGSVTMPSGPKTCLKLSMKVSLDHFAEEARLRGLKKLQFHAMRNDASLMKERLGYWLFRQIGVPAPRVVHARVVINGELTGIFALVEQIDGRFTRSRFGDGGEGNLYKEVWPMYDAEQVYLDALETNAGESPSGARMLAFANALAAAEGTELGEVVDEYLDRDAIASYLAVDRTIAHADGPLAFYCGTPAGQGGNPGPFGNHNYYWYEEAAQSRFWIIAWDLDLAFNGFGPSGQMQRPWNEPLSGMECECPAASGGFALSRLPAGCDKLVQGLGMLHDDYRARVDALLAGPFSPDSVTARLDAWSAQIAPLVAEQAQDPEQPTVEAWQAALARFRTTLESLRTAASSVE